MIQVFFKKSPTGSPFFLAYSQGEHGLVSEQKAIALEKAGIIDPIKNAIDRGIPAGDFITTTEAEKKPEQVLDLTTEEGAKSKFGDNLDAMKAYCDENGVKYGKSAKRPEYFWAKIAKHNSK